MILWITEHLATIIVCLLLAMAVVFIVVGMIKNKRKGKSFCSGCKSCPMGGSCHQEKTNS